MTIMPNKNEKHNAISKCCEKFFKRFKIKKKENKEIIKKVNATKEKGYPAYDIFAFMVRPTKPSS